MAGAMGRSRRAVATGLGAVRVTGVSLIGVRAVTVACGQTSSSVRKRTGLTPIRGTEPRRVVSGNGLGSMGPTKECATTCLGMCIWCDMENSKTRNTDFPTAP
ncbi:GyrI-like small molecule binding domain protein [Microcella alkaliphila]|uniref:GyrI-like small molecule binding domain protein n=1 Tax=Microcella alkaliphila TaxID=279828 RepID=A0A0U5BCH8_9MICO|nr:GyrI-like small molecule binding domain protein [Microcella alkaliphila]